MVVVQVEDPAPRPCPVPTLSLTSAILCEGSFPSNKTPFCLDNESGAEGQAAVKMLLYWLDNSCRVASCEGSSTDMDYDLRQTSRRLFLDFSATSTDIFD